MKWFTTIPENVNDATVHTSECGRFVIASTTVTERMRYGSFRSRDQHEVYDRAYYANGVDGRVTHRFDTLIAAKDFVAIRIGERRDPAHFPYHFRVLVANEPPSKREVRERINPGREWWMWRADMRMGKRTTTYCQYWFEDARAAVAFRMLYPQAEIVKGGN